MRNSDQSLFTSWQLHWIPSILPLWNWVTFLRTFGVAQPDYQNMMDVQYTLQNAHLTIWF